MTEEDAKALREVGERPDFDFEPLDHLELAQRHGWIEMEAAAEASGSRFAYLLGDLVMLEFALVRFAMETLRAEGFEPAIPPVLVREHALFGTGFFPGEREMIYEVPRDELFLVGTSEVPLAALHAGQILDAEELPKRYARLLHLLPPRGRGGRQATPAASSASTSSTRSRCSASSSRGTPGRSTSASSRSRRASSERWRSPIGWWTSRSATSGPRPPASSTARLGSQARSATEK